MSRKKKSLWAMVMAQFVGLAVVGCVNRVGMSQALADDMALTVAAATQGFLTGVFTRDDVP